MAKVSAFVGKFDAIEANGQQNALIPNRIGCPYSEAMRRAFKIGDHVSWNSEVGRVSGTIVKVHTNDVNYKGYIHHASFVEPQYEIKSDKTDHIALHKAGALRHLRR